jgi:hypothetical protein
VNIIGGERGRKSFNPQRRTTGIEEEKPESWPLNHVVCCIRLIFVGVKREEEETEVT